MTESSDKPQSNRIYRDVVLKCITDKPGSVVYRHEIADSTGLSEDQVSATIQRIMKVSDKHPIGKDIEVVVTARAWRYVPNARAQRAARTSAPNVKTNVRNVSDSPLRRPLTQVIREYFELNPNRVIYIDELHGALSGSDNPIDIAQLRVGISNARQHHDQFRNRITTVVSGRAWMYATSVSAANEALIGNVESNRPPETPVLTPTTIVPAPTPPVRASIGDDNLLILEKLGELGDGASLVRDESQKLYRLSPM